jgi:hypothetical protein
MDYNALVRFLHGRRPGMDAPKGGVSSHPKNIYREPTMRALEQAPDNPPRAYWPADTKRYRAT